MSDTAATPPDDTPAAKPPAVKVGVPIPPPLLKRIDAYIAASPEPRPNRAKAIRQLVRRGLNAKGKGKGKAAP